MTLYERACQLMDEQLGMDNLYSLATCVDNDVTVRVINGFYKDGAIYLITNKSTKKMKQIVQNKNVAICKDLFNASGSALNLGHPNKKKNIEMRQILKDAFSAFYDKHVDENNSSTCILKINLVKAIIHDLENRYTIDFEMKKVKVKSFYNDIIN